MNYRPFPRPKCLEGLCIFYSIPLPRVNVQTPYRFQSFLSQYVSLLDTKSPGERGTPRGNKTLLTISYPILPSPFTLDGNANISLAIGGRVGCNTDSFHVRKLSRSSAGFRILQLIIQFCLECIVNFQRLYTFQLIFCNRFQRFTHFIRVNEGMTRINVKIKAGQETELNGAGPNIPESAMQQLEAKLDALQEGDILILAGSIPASLAQDTYERLLARLQGKGVRAVVDATRDLLVNVLKYRPFLVKPNNHELGEIVGRRLTTDAEIVAAAAVLQSKGARNVLVSMAGDGALLLDEKGCTHRIGCPKGQVVNSVGAGDSMVAGFVAGYLQSGDYNTALRLGTACGSATAFSLGLAKKADIDALLKEL